MRVLVTTQPGFGHFHPLVPLAQALATAGHEVAVACAPSFRPTVESAGVRAVPAGIDWRVSGMGDAFPSMRQAATFPEAQRQPLRLPGGLRGRHRRAHGRRTCSRSPSAGAPT